MVKVLFIYRFLPQYRIHFFEQLKSKLLEDGIELHLIYGKSTNSDIHKKDEIDIEWAKYIPNRTIKIGKIELIHQPVLKYLRNKHLIIVQPENKLVLTYYLMFARHFSQYKLGFWSHGRNVQKAENTWQNKLHNLYLKKCDWWFAYTPSVKEYLLKHKFSIDKITNVQNAIDTLEIKTDYSLISENEINDLKTELGVFGNKTAIFCGGIYPEKRIDFILETCYRIKKNIPEFHMIFIGAGIEAERIKIASKKNRWIHYMGPKFGRDRLKYFKVSSIQLMPGSVGLGILDSFALMTPIITTNTPFQGPEIDYLENGKNGVITNNNLENYADTIVDLLKNDKHLDLINGCINSAKKYTVEKMVENFKNGILSCLFNENQFPKIIK
jgi:L-malate glycosyltransferase